MNKIKDTFSKDYKDKYDVIETNFERIEQNKIERNNDNDDYPPNNICYDCGKQLKWENRCPDCGILSDFDFSEYSRPVHANTQIKNNREESVESFIKEIRDDCGEDNSALNNDERNNGRDHKTMQ